MIKVSSKLWHKIITEAHLGTGMDAFTHARNLDLNIRLVVIPECVPSEFERWNKIQQFYRSGKMEGLVEALINNLHQKPNVAPVPCFVADTFLRWAVSLAKKLSPLSIFFWMHNVSTFSISYHLETVQCQAGLVSVIHNLAVIFIESVDLPSFFKPSAI